MGLKVARSEAARLALTFNCPLVPVAIEGSPSLFRPLLRRAHVRVTVCEPILPRPNELALALTDRLMFSLAKNLPPNLQGVYAEAPVGF
jgi:1-acyl-sn-glycerol-3-phosphate acyltransferase